MLFGEVNITMIPNDGGFLGRPTEAWCGDFVTDIYKRAQVPLPSMQAGCHTGFAYCPDAVDYGRAHDAVRNSWES